METRSLTYRPNARSQQKSFLVRGKGVFIAIMIHKPTPPKPQARGPQKEVLFELQRHGNILRVIAIDPVTGTEVIMIADPRQNMEIIKRLAARKLLYVLEKNRAKAEQKNDPNRF